MIIRNNNELHNKYTALTTGDAAAHLPGTQQRETSRYLVTMYMGIGDAVTVGLAAIDQLLQHDPSAFGHIDVLCNALQAELFMHDPRIRCVFETSRLLFPPPEITAWLKGLLPRGEAARLIQALQARHYMAVVAGMFAPGLYARLHAPTISPHPLELWQDWRALHHLQDRPMGKIVRRAVSHYFGIPLPFDALSETIPLYLPSALLQRATHVMQRMYAQAGIAPQRGRLLLVAPDTASDVTRPPVTLLAQALRMAVADRQDWLVGILPAYTRPDVAHALYQALRVNKLKRVLLLAAEPRATLLETTALIDRADIFVTGDTGVMHLAAAEKRLRCDDTSSAPRNATRIIALFGGTNPALYGYSQRSIIIGRGRAEQRAYRPGIAKESYRIRGRNLFDHIAPQDLTRVLVECMDQNS